MQLKKYVSVGVCVALLLTAGVVRIDSANVKVRKKGKETQITSVKEMGEVLSAFADKAEVFAPYKDIQSSLQKSVEPMALTSGSVKSAKITVDTVWDYTYSRSITENSVNTHTYLTDGATEKATYYFGEDASYLIVEGTYWFNNLWSATLRTGGENEKTALDWDGAIEYQTEWYFDTAQSLMRINATTNRSRGKKTVTDEAVAEEKIGTDELAGIPLGKWLRVEDLKTVVGEEKAYSAIVYKSGNVFTAFGEILTGLYSQFQDQNGKYAFVEAGAIDSVDYDDYTLVQKLARHTFGFEYGNEDVFGDAGGKTWVGISKNNPPTLYSNYNLRCEYQGDYTPNCYAGVQTQISVENVNCTSVKKLKKPKLGAIDSTALTAN